MEYIKGKIIKQLVEFFGRDYRRINHAMEVLKYAEQIMDSKNDYDYDVVIAAALLHDVGIKPSEEKLGYNSGKTQEEYGPAAARELLGKIDFPENEIEKVCQIIGNHHSPSRYDYIELEILKAADKIVNISEKD